MSPYYHAFSLLGINVWIWSTAFHARDNVFTERLDYHCATAWVMYNVLLPAVRLLGPGARKAHRALLLAALAYLALHVAYLNLVQFDYGAARCGAPRLRVEHDGLGCVCAVPRDAVVHVELP
jgi:hypothetical protein